MSDAPTGGDVPLVPRHDWRTRLPVPGARSSVDPPARPIDAPPAPQQLHAPHQLVTLDQALGAFRLLAEGVLPHPPQVLVTHTNGGSALLSLKDLPRINYVTDVTSMVVSWTYQDTSSITGTLIDRGQQGSLTVRGSGQALAAAQRCVEDLQAVRPWRAGLRAWLAGRGPEGVYFAVLIATFVLYLANVDGATDTFTGLEAPLTRAYLIGGIFLTLLAWTFNQVVAGLFSRARRRIGGTRLATRSQAERIWLTPELGILASVVGVPVALASLVVGLLAL